MNNYCEWCVRGASGIIYLVSDGWKRKELKCRTALLLGATLSDFGREEKKEVERVRLMMVVPHHSDAQGRPSRYLNLAWWH